MSCLFGTFANLGEIKQRTISVCGCVLDMSLFANLVLQLLYTSAHTYIYLHFILKDVFILRLYIINETVFRLMRNEGCNARVVVFSRTGSTPSRQVYFS